MEMAKTYLVAFLGELSARHERYYRLNNFCWFFVVYIMSAIGNGGDLSLREELTNATLVLRLDIGRSAACNEHRGATKSRSWGSINP